ncbi:MAG: DUF423 domain-containing protein [Lysobacterales bacterium]
MANPWLAVSAGIGCIGVALGALGAHLLTVVKPEQFDLANRYHLIHAVVLVAMSLTLTPETGTARQLVMLGFVVGTALFCGALYLSSLGLSGPRLAPAGGSILILSWLALAISALRS